MQRREDGVALLIRQRGEDREDLPLPQTNGVHFMGQQEAERNNEEQVLIHVSSGADRGAQRRALLYRSGVALPRLRNMAPRTAKITRRRWPGACTPLTRRRRAWFPISGFAGDCLTLDYISLYLNHVR